jgi:hypothetical protein
MRYAMVVLPAGVFSQESGGIRILDSQDGVAALRKPRQIFILVKYQSSLCRQNILLVDFNDPNKEPAQNKRYFNHAQHRTRGKWGYESCVYSVQSIEGLG